MIDNCIMTKLLFNTGLCVVVILIHQQVIELVILVNCKIGTPELQLKKDFLLLEDCSKSVA